MKAGRREEKINDLPAFPPSCESLRGQWGHHPPVPADLRAYVDWVLKPRVDPLADEMKDNLNLWPPGEGLDLEQTQLYQTIDAFAGAMSALGDGAKNCSRYKLDSPVSKAARERHSKGGRARMRPGGSARWCPGTAGVNLSPVEPRAPSLAGRPPVRHHVIQAVMSRSRGPSLSGHR
jgi:hypothetical protein